MAYLTYFDVVEHLIAASFGGPQDAEQRDIRTAVHRCYEELSNIRDWSWQHAHGRVVTAAPTTSTVDSYASPTVTLSALVATASQYSHIKIGNVVCQIASVGSATVGLSTVTTVTLDSQVKPASVSSGDTVTLYKTLYSMPSDFRNLDEPSDEFNWWSGAYVTPDEAMKMERVNFSTGSPLHWTVIKSPTSHGYVLKLVGYPTSAETVDFTYRRSLRPLRYSGHEANSRVGTITALVATNNVSGSGTAFTAAMEGSVLRIGTATDYPGPITSITPYATELLVDDVSSATSMRAGSNFTFGSGVKYLITDPIDLPSHMHNVMLSGAEYWLARIRGSKTEEKYQLYQRDLRLAMESDQLAPLSGRSARIWNDGGWRSPLLADNFSFS